MASKVHNISGEITQSLLDVGDNVKVSSISLCNTNNTLNCTANLFIERPTTGGVAGGTFYILKNVVLPPGATLVHDFTFNNAKLALYIKLTKSASETPTATVILN